MRLAVNIDHIATIRQARKTDEPDPVTAAAVCELAGASGITVHLRADRRHIQDRDVEILRRTVTTKLNVEMAATRDTVRLAQSVKPDCVTLVPERRDEVTTEGGLDVVLHHTTIERVVAELLESNITVSIFVDPDIEQIRGCHKIGAPIIEINTGKYSEQWRAKQASAELEKIRNAAKAAKKLGMTIYGGHGLTYRNITPITEITDIEELNIGHSIISRAAFVGLDQAVREMLELLKHRGV